MFCTNCGKQIDDDSLFCPFCGAKVVDNLIKNTVVEQNISKENVVQNTTNIKIQTQTQGQPVFNQQPYQQNFTNTQPKQKISNKMIALIAGGAAVVVVVIISVILFVFGPKSIDIFKGGTLTIKGYNGFGDARFSYDDSIDGPLGELMIDEMNSEAEYYSTCAYNTASNKCIKSHEKFMALNDASSSFGFEYELEDDKINGKLSNGDKITVRVVYNEQAFKKAKYKFSKKTKTFTIEGLEEPEEIDLMPYIDIEWKSDGFDYYLSLELDDDCPVDELDYELSYPNSDGYATLTIDDVSLGQKYGYKIKGDEYTSSIYVGQPPQRIDSVNNSNREEIEDLANDVLMNVYCEKCGWILIGNKEELIKDFTITNLYASYGTIYAEFDIHTDANKTYRKSIKFDAYINSEGEYVCSSEFDKDSLSCSISHGTWPER